MKSKRFMTFAKEIVPRFVMSTRFEGFGLSNQNGSNVLKTPLDRFPNSGIIAKCDMDRHLMDVAIRSGHLWEGFSKPWPITA